MRKSSFFISSALIRVSVFLLGSCMYIQLTSFNISFNKEIPFHHLTKKTITSYYNLHLQLERTDLNAYPPIAAERAALLGMTAMFAFQSSQDSGMHRNNLPVLLNEVYAIVLKNIYKHIPNASRLIEQERVRLSQQMNFPATQMQEQSEKAKRIARLTIENNPAYCVSAKEPIFHISLSHHDLLHQTNASNTLPNALSVYISENRNASVRISDDALSKLDMHLQKEAMKVFFTSQHLTEEKKWIAEYWSDDVRGLTHSPVGRWLSIANQLACKNVLPAEKLPEIYFRLGIALHDAVTMCWKYKYEFNIARPSNIIRKRFDSHWQPLHENPDFPSFPSGHATIGATASEILSFYVKNSTPFTDNSHLNRTEFLSKPRKYASLTEMARENAVSRIYMGVHYPTDCSEGLRLGEKIGKNVNNYPLSILWQSVSPDRYRIPDYCNSEVSTTYK